jgi:aldose 1-epimerase
MKAVPRQPPSGEQHPLRNGDQHVMVTEVGATLRHYVVDGRAVIDGFAEDEMCAGGRGQHLIPWPNRIGDGRYRFLGLEHQLPLNEPARANAIHGLARWANWTAERVDDSRLTMRLRLHAQQGYPFSLDLEVGYRLDADGLAVETVAGNIGATAAPYGCGAHPYLTVGTPTVDPCSLRIPAAGRLLSDERQLPIGRAPVEGGELDFRRPREIGGTRLDDAFTDLIPDPDGRARAVLESPTGERVVLWVDATYGWLMVFTGDALEDASQRRRGVAIEPMTCPPNAFQSGEDLITLPPGEMTRSSWGIDISGFRR